MENNFKKLRESLLEMQKIESIASLLHWDQETFMPENGGEIRAKEIAYLSSLKHQKVVSDEFKNELGKFVNIENGEILSNDISDNEKRFLDRVWKDFHFENALPQKFVEELSELTSKSQMNWVKAKEGNDFSIFEPYLEKMVEMKKKEADYYGYSTNRYDALLGQFEPGITTEKLDNLFGGLRSRLIELIKKIQNSSVEIQKVKGEFDENEQWKFGMKIIKDMGFNLKSGRQDKSAHPFTISFHPSDVRLTTRVHKDNFLSSLFASIHEAGHGIYEQGLLSENFGTPFGQAASFGIHESQSRLWENQVGRSKDFWKHYLPILKEHFSQFESINLDEYYKMINSVEPSLIRIEADEVTYSLHIMLRYEIEKMLINDNLQVKDLPEIWNKNMKEFFDIIPDSDAKGVLQDVHWSMGAFGYFPSYALGNFYAAQFYKKASDEINDFDNQIQNGNLLPLKKWLNTNIHQYGRKYLPNELVKKVVGNEMSVEPFIAYLENKYGEIYELKNE
ncbi:MAG: carboxypeptidase M32, partial [Candidatus Marinimicrobia bacterium]|nr:carboxypeptidase M32 [Candidatus Neomarinimicrobiota bacterium]